MKPQATQSQNYFLQKTKNKNDDIIENYPRSGGEEEESLKLPCSERSLLEAEGARLWLLLDLLGAGGA